MLNYMGFIVFFLFFYRGYRIGIENRVNSLVLESTNRFLVP